MANLFGLFSYEPIHFWKFCYNIKKREHMLLDLNSLTKIEMISSYLSQSIIRASLFTFVYNSIKALKMKKGINTCYD